MTNPVQKMDSNNAKIHQHTSSGIDHAATSRTVDEFGQLIYF